MKKTLKLILILLFTNIVFGQIENKTVGGDLKKTNDSDCDNINYIPRTSKQSFNTFLSGVKYALIEDYRNANVDVKKTKLSLIRYLEGMGFSVIEMSKEELEITDIQCDQTFVGYSTDFNKSNSVDITLSFFSCAGDEYSFKTTKSYDDNGGIIKNTNTYFYNAFVEMQGKKKPNYSSSFTINLAKKQTCWNEAKLKKFIQINSCDKIEGIYESTSSSDTEAKYKVAVRKISGIYYLIYLSGAKNIKNWSEGEIKATLEPSATPLLFKANWIMADKSENNNYYITFEQGFFNLLTDDQKKTLYIKMFPASTDNFNSSIESPSSGTGYAISSDGYVVTNHHVTNEASSIIIRGVNGDFSKSYTAKVVIDDKNNDLTILKIDDPSFTSLGTIPYIIANRASDVGSSVFVLGYPLRSTMGDEIKLTNGIVSSKSGYQGDVTSYQISAPVQPGNSGGPLFDDKGNIIGIINAKHVGAENASYAIKTSYLMNLIDLMPSPPKLQTVSKVAGKTLSEQIKILKKFIYIIEIN